ncbi:hypothetical protein WJX73_009891 [Symbiochloris irregularis]|uniref:AB hydrolase-1 domain-containing protein n=1 Tax=Symbiochloris irregularis TaxID=706552 RepID=A0AAW1NSJ2_9CHLO
MSALLAGPILQSRSSMMIRALMGVPPAIGPRKGSSQFYGAVPPVLPPETWTAVQAVTECASWGAKNAVRNAIFGQQRQVQLHVETRATAAEFASPAHDTGLKERLDFRPSLSFPQVALCLVLTSIVSGLAYGYTAPAAISLWYAIRMAALCAVTLTVSRSWLLERDYKEQQVEEPVLRGPDSKFRSMGDCKVHYTKHSTSRIPSARSGPATAVHCYHGFGANTGSWSYLRQPLASVLDAQVTAHDMPGFGLTQRLKDPSSYTLGFNGRVGRVLMDAELAEESIIPPFNVEAAAQAPTLESSLMFPARQMSVDMEVDLSEARAAAAESNAAAHPVRRILMGHSMGAVSAVAEAIKRPEGLAALVLVSPALVALPMEPEAEAPGKSGHTHTAGQSMEAGFAYGHLMSKPTAPPRRMDYPMLIGLISPHDGWMQAGLVGSSAWWGLSGRWYGQSPSFGCGS